MSGRITAEQVGAAPLEPRSIAHARALRMATMRRIESCHRELRCGEGSREGPRRRELVRYSDALSATSAHYSRWINEAQHRGTEEVRRCIADIVRAADRAAAACPDVRASEHAVRESLRAYALGEPQRASLRCLVHAALDHLDRLAEAGVMQFNDDEHAAFDRAASLMAPASDECCADASE
jgi:hypothetical protein